MQCKYTQDGWAQIQLQVSYAGIARLFTIAFKICGLSIYNKKKNYYNI